MINKSAAMLILTLLSTQAYSQTSVSSQSSNCAGGDDSIACQQKRELDAIWVDMNKSSMDVIDTVMTDPGKAREMGCLDNIRSLDLSVFTIDINGLWTSLYSALKDQLMDRVCDAIDQKVNEELNRLTFQLEAPMGLGEISLGRGSNANSLDDFGRVRARITNEEARRAVVEEVLDEQPRLGMQPITTKNVQNSREVELGVDDRTRVRKDAEELEKKIKSFKSLFKKDGDNDNDG